VALLVGLERSGPYLRRARVAGSGEGGPAWLRADLRAPPLRDGAFDAAYSWYSSLFMWSDASNEAALGEAARLLRPGGRLLVHHANPLALVRSPVDRARRTLPDGSAVEELSSFDPVAGVDRCRRRLVRPDGRSLEGTAELRYYTPSEWAALAPRVGLRLTKLTSSAPPPGGVLGPEAPDLIALLEKP
jgi:SAM-dependent methyltransferase